MAKELFIDMTNNSIVLLVQDDIMLHQKIVKTNKNLVDIFDETIDNFLKELNFTYSDLSKVFFINGPGTFTGVRIINIFIKTLKMINKNVEIHEMDFLRF